MCRFAARSSFWICRAAPVSAPTMSAGFPATTLRMRRSIRARFTAVGRAAFRWRSTGSSVCSEERVSGRSQTARFEHHAPRRGNADRGRTAHGEIGDRRSHGIGIAAIQIHLLERQPALIEQAQDLVAVGDGADQSRGGRDRSFRQGEKYLRAGYRMTCPERRCATGLLTGHCLARIRIMATVVRKRNHGLSRRSEEHQGQADHPTPNSSRCCATQCLSAQRETSARSPLPAN